MQKLAISCFCLIMNVTAPVRAVTLNSTGLGICESQFLDCACNSTATNSSNCSVSLSTCIAQIGFSNGTKPQACYLAESAWNNLRISAVFSVVVFLFANLIFPAFLKGTAKWITKIGACDPHEYPVLSRFGRALLYVTDPNGDGKVTAPDLIAPQTIFSFSSVALPVYQWTTANDVQANCDYQNSLLTH